MKMKMKIRIIMMMVAMAVVTGFISSAKAASFTPIWYDNLYHLDKLSADGCKKVLVLPSGGSEVPPPTPPDTHDYDQFRNGEVENYLNMADKRGIKVILGVYWFLRWNTNHTGAQVMADMDANMASLKYYAAKFASHPALAGWYTLDEPPAGDTRLIGLAARAYGILKVAAPSLPVYMAFTFASNSSPIIPVQYKDSYDVFMWDCYSFFRQSIATDPTTYYAEWIDMESWKKDFIRMADINKGFEMPKPVIPILQAYGKPGAFPDYAARLPSKNEMRYMVYYSANNGMHAVSLFYYNWLLDSVATPAPNPYTGTGEQWRKDVGKPVTDEMMIYADAIDKGPVPGAVSGLDSDINGKVYKDPSTGKYYLLTVKDSALVVRWKLDETSGTTVADASGSGNTGTITGGATWVTGKVGGALSFDGVNGSVTCGSVGPGLGGGGNTKHTVAAWVKVNALPANRAWIMVLGNAGPGSHHWTIDRTGKTQFGAWGGNAVQPVLPVGQWRHVAITFDGTNLKSYVNGALVQSAAAKFNMFNLKGLPLTLAKAQIGENAFNGVLDDVRVYNRELTAVEVVQAMSASTPSAFTINLPGTWSRLAEYGAGNIPIVGNKVSPLGYSMYQVRNFELIP